MPTALLSQESERSEGTEFREGKRVRSANSGARFLIRSVRPTV